MHCYAFPPPSLKTGMGPWNTAPGPWTPYVWPCDCMSVTRAIAYVLNTPYEISILLFPTSFSSHNWFRPLEYRTGTVDSVCLPWYCMSVTRAIAYVWKHHMKFLYCYFLLLSPLKTGTGTCNVAPGPWTQYVCPCDCTSVTKAISIAYVLKTPYEILVLHTIPFPQNLFWHSI